MKKLFFSFIEERIYFKVTTFFWHLLVGLGVLATTVGIIVVLWNFLPTFKKEVVKQPFPDKEKYPSAVSVSSDEINSILAIYEESKRTKPYNSESPKTQPEQVQNNTQPNQNEYNDDKGENDFQVSIDRLKKLIPPDKFTKIWEPIGYYTYPSGQQYWDKTHNEIYRKFIATKPGLTDRLKEIANNYSERKKILDGYINAITPLNEDFRADFLLLLVDSLQKPINVSLANSLSKIFPELGDFKKKCEILSKLVNFSRQFGASFIDYEGNIISKFDSRLRNKILDVLEDNYSSTFKTNIQNQIESTNLFLPMLSKIKPDVQDIALREYYNLYTGKNYAREETIRKIDNKYIEDTTEINSQYQQSIAESEFDYQNRKQAKEDNRNFWYKAVGIGLLVIILISNILVIFNMQRTLRKINDKLGADTQSKNNNDSLDSNIQTVNKNDNIDSKNQIQNNYDNIVENNEVLKKEEFHDNNIQSVIINSSPVLDNLVGKLNDNLETNSKIQERSDKEEPNSISPNNGTIKSNIKPKISLKKPLSSGNS